MPGDPIQPFFFRHPLSAGSHLLFVGWTSYCAVVLWRLTCDPARRAAIAVFGLSLVALYLASGLYHAVSAEQVGLVELLRRADLSLIHVLIAGTSTLPIVLLSGRWRTILLALVWTVAIGGVLSKSLFPLPPPRATIGLYVAAGSLVVPALWPMARITGWRGLVWLVGGALAYAVGGTCEAVGRPVVWPGIIGPHEILHLCDMVGSTMHLVFAMRFVARG